MEWEVRQKDHSDLGLGKGNLHFAPVEDLVVEVSDGLEAVLHQVKLDKCHVFLIRIAQDLHSLHAPVLIEDLVQRVFAADILLQGTDMKSLRGRVDCKRAVGGEPLSHHAYRSNDQSQKTHSQLSPYCGKASSLEQGMCNLRRLPMSLYPLRQVKAMAANSTVLNLMQTLLFFLQMKEMLPKLLNRLYMHLILMPSLSQQQRMGDLGCKFYFIFSEGFILSPLLLLL